jgi:hypothetical protein
MTVPTSFSRQTVATASIVLDQGRVADRLSRGLTIASLVSLVAISVLTPHTSISAMLLIGAAALCGLVELWFAARVLIDAALFHQLALTEDSPEWGVLDGALIELRMLPEAKAGRPTASRIAGAFRLLRLQIIALIVQFGLIVAAALAGWAR